MSDRKPTPVSLEDIRRLRAEARERVQALRVTMAEVRELKEKAREQLAEMREMVDWLRLLRRIE